jgi:hypothetical protein
MQLAGLAKDQRAAIGSVGHDTPLRALTHKPPGTAQQLWAALWSCAPSSRPHPPCAAANSWHPWRSSGGQVSSPLPGCTTAAQASGLLRAPGSGCKSRPTLCAPAAGWPGKGGVHPYPPDKAHEHHIELLLILLQAVLLSLHAQAQMPKVQGLPLRCWYR